MSVGATARLDESTLRKAQRHLRRADPRLGTLIRRVGPCRLEPDDRPYEALLRSVIHQQLAGSAARAIELRFKTALAGPTRYPRPKVLASASLEELRACGLSLRKAETLQRIAAAFACGELSTRRLRSGDEESVIRSLTALKGVGDWTAHMLLIFSLGRTDVLPTGDYGVRKGAWALYELDALPGRKELDALAEPWRPYRSVASWYLWRAADEAGRLPTQAKT